MVTDENGKLSSTRFVLMVMVSLFCLISIAGIPVQSIVYETIREVVLLCLGSTALRTTIKNNKGD